MGPPNPLKGELLLTGKFYHNFYPKNFIQKTDLPDASGSPLKGELEGARKLEGAFTPNPTQAFTTL
jgi:hypothetical protein